MAYIFELMQPELIAYQFYLFCLDILEWLYISENITGWDMQKLRTVVQQIVDLMGSNPTYLMIENYCYGVLNITASVCPLLSHA